MSEDTLRRQINELDDKVAAMAAQIENDHKLIERMGQTNVLHADSLRAVHEDVRLLRQGLGPCE